MMTRATTALMRAVSNRNQRKVNPLVAPEDGASDRVSPLGRLAVHIAPAFGDSHIAGVLIDAPGDDS